jgi:hypothetical protein
MLVYMDVILVSHFETRRRIDSVSKESAEENIWIS